MLVLPLPMNGQLAAAPHTAPYSITSQYEGTGDDDPVYCHQTLTAGQTEFLLYL